MAKKFDQIRENQLLFVFDVITNSMNVEKVYDINKDSYDCEFNGGKYVVCSWDSSTHCVDDYRNLYIFADLDEAKEFIQKRIESLRRQLSDLKLF